jgi:hypothetical protein
VQNRLLASVSAETFNRLRPLQCVGLKPREIQGIPRSIDRRFGGSIECDNPGAEAQLGPANSASRW